MLQCVCVRIATKARSTSPTGLVIAVVVKQHLLSLNRLRPLPEFEIFVDQAVWGGAAKA